MEELYNPESYNASEPINLQEYFDKYRQECYGLVKTYISSEKDKTDAIKKELNLNVDVEVFNQLEDACSIDLLDKDEDVFKPVDIPNKLTNKHRLKEFYPVTSEALELDSVKYREDVLKYFKSRYKNVERLFFSCNNFSLLNLNTNIPGDGKDIYPGSEFIMKILVYKPMSINRGLNNSEKVRLSQEIEVLGSNLLSELADKIECLTDYGLYKEVETTDENLSNLVNGKTHYPSSSFFIENVFYNDMRSPNAIDYSEPCRQWAKSKGMAPFGINIMDSTKFCDLKPRLGYPYVYLHQGDCEHIVAFSDAKLIQDCDVLNRGCYPRICVNKRKSNIQCYMCTFDYAKWIVSGSDRFPQEKIFLCTECCNSYNFMDGHKVGSFKLFPLYDRRMMGHDEDESEEEPEEGE